MTTRNSDYNIKPTETASQETVSHQLIDASVLVRSQTGGGAAPSKRGRMERGNSNTYQSQLKTDVATEANPYGYEVVTMGTDEVRTGTPPRKRRRYQRRNSKTPAMLRLTTNTPLLLQLDLLEDEKEHINERFMNMDFFAEETSSFNDSYNSDLSASWASLAVETAEELVAQVKTKQATKRKSLSDP